MEFSDTKFIPASPEETWYALFEPDVLRACIPGCQSLEGSHADGFRAVSVQKIGPVKATFEANVTIQNIEAGRTCRIKGEGKGGLAGFAKGHAHVELSPEGDGTRLHYAVEVQIGGKIAQLGSRILKGVAANLAGQFFTSFERRIAPETGQPAK